MTLILNTRQDFAAQSLAGFVSANASRVRHAPGGVVRSTQRTPGKVALVIGGGSGTTRRSLAWSAPEWPTVQSAVTSSPHRRPGR
jgi:hypothetical protein